MKSQPWIPVLAWAVLLSGAVGQAWCQPKCASGVVRPCVPAAEADKAKGESAETVNEHRSTCQQTDWPVDKAVVSCGLKTPGKGVQKDAVCHGPKAAVKCAPTCGVGHSQKNVPCAPTKGMTAKEPRKLALPHGSYQRLRTYDAPKAASTRGSAKCSSCQTDCRHDTIFGTETIFGGVSLSPFRDQHPCPYERTGAGRPKSLVPVLSKLDASLQKIFVCHRGTCGSANGKGTCDCQSKTNWKDDMGTAPILEGRPEEPEQEGNPFHDDAVEPAPLPPTPRMTSRAPSGSEIRNSQQPIRLGIAHAKPVSSYSSTPARQSDRLTSGERTPKPVAGREQTPSKKSAKPLLTSTQLD
jgi:hypothetical protein